MTWIYYIAACLASYRLGLMLSEETGPFFMFRKARTAVPRKSSFWEGIRCIWCATTWFAVIPALYFCLTKVTPWIEFPLWWMAIAGGALACNQLFTKD